MAKTALLFRHNGRDAAIFVDGGVNLLTALRELVGDMTPKFGCGQGGCGACTVLIDGTPTRSCVTRLGAIAARDRATHQLSNGSGLACTGGADELEMPGFIRLRDGDAGQGKPIE